jgi:hypothetical protein
MKILGADQAGLTLPAVSDRAPCQGQALELERTFGETKRRAKVIGRFPGETSAISLIWAVLDRASAGWRGVAMTPASLRQLRDLRRSLLQPPTQLRPQHSSAPADSGTAETVTATA